MEKAALVLKQKKRALLAQWEEEVKGLLPASAQTASLALRDHMPMLLEDLQALLLVLGEEAPPQGATVYDRIARHGVEHGRHRASTAHYTIDQILREYVIFHRILTDVLVKNDAYNLQVATVVKYTIDGSMLNSAASYNEAIQKTRQKIIGILAHDMRNPITVALTALDILEDQEGDQKREQVRQMAQNSLTRVLGMIDDLLDSVSREAGEGMLFEFEQVDLRQSISVVYMDASELYPGRMQLEDSQQEILGIFDGTMVQRALENLVVNAFKYGSSVSPVTLTVENLEKEVRLKVHNFGNPISENRQQEILQFLNTSRGNGAGHSKSWGMGLTLVLAVAEAHGGHLLVNSTPEKGTSFTMVLTKDHNRPGKKHLALAQVAKE